MTLFEASSELKFVKRIKIIGENHEENMTSLHQEFLKKHEELSKRIEEKIWVDHVQRVDLEKLIENKVYSEYSKEFQRLQES